MFLLIRANFVSSQKYLPVQSLRLAVLRLTGERIDAIGRAGVRWQPT